MRCLTVLVCLLAATAVVAEPIVQDSFAGAGNGQPTGWRFSATRGDVRGSWDNTEPAGGHSLRLEVSEPSGRATFSRTDRLELKPDTAYRLQVKVMRIGVQPSGRAYLILYENGLEDPAHWHTTPYLTGTQDWETYTVLFRTLPDTTWARVQCKLWDSTGYAWFDDLSIEELPPGAEAKVQVAQLQQPTNDGAPLQLMWYPAQRRPDCTLHLLSGLTNPLSFFPWGDASQISRPFVILETPPQVRVSGPVPCSREPIPDDIPLTPESVTRDGRELLRWRVPLPEEPLKRRLRAPRIEWTLYCFVYVQPQADCPREFTWRWQTEVAGQAGPWHEIPAEVTQPEGGSLPRVPGFPLYAQHTDALRLPTPAGRQAVLDYLAYAGIEGGLSLNNYQPEYAPIDRELGAAGFFTWAWLWDGYSRREQQSPRLVLDTGETTAGVCPQAQVDRDPAWWQTLQEAYRVRLATGAKMLIINFEPPVFNCCFCEHCRAAFAAHAKLPPEQVAAMTPQEIQKLPDSAWGKFRAWQNGQIVKHHCAAIHAIDPEVKVGLCGPPFTLSIADRGMDIRQFEPEVAFHAPMIYEVGTQYAGSMRSSCEGATQPVIPFVLISDHAVPGVFPTPAQLRQNLLATAASGGEGAVLWVGIESLDAEYMQRLRQSLREIALLQPYLQGAKRAEGAKLETARQHVRTVKVGDKSFEVSAQNTDLPVWQWTWESPQGNLAVLINYNNAAPQPVRLGGPGLERARALFGPQPTVEAGQPSVTLPPGEAVALTW
jgi:hypothetical protein